MKPISLNLPTLDRVHLRWIVLGLSLLLLVGDLVYKAFFHVNLEEFRLITVTEEISRGRHLYQDTHWMYGEIAPYLYLAWAAAFGNHLLAARILAIGLIAATFIGVYLLALQWTADPFLSAWAALLSQWQFRFPTYENSHFLAGGLIFLSFFLLFYEGLFKKRNTQLVSVGIVSALGFLQQPVLEGTAAAFFTALLIGGSPEKRRELLFYGLGFLGCIALVGGGLFLSNGVSPLGGIPVQTETTAQTDWADFFRQYSPLWGRLLFTWDYLVLFVRDLAQVSGEGLRDFLSHALSPRMIRVTLLSQVFILLLMARRRLRIPFKPVAALLVWSVFVDLRGSRPPYMQYVFLLLTVGIAALLPAVSRRGIHARLLSGALWLLFVIGAVRAFDLHSLEKYQRLSWPLVRGVYLERHAAQALEKIERLLRSGPNDAMVLGYFWTPVPRFFGFDQPFLGKYHGLDYILCGRGPKGLAFVSEIRQRMPSWILISRSANFYKSNWKRMILEGDPVAEADNLAFGQLRQMLKDRYHCVEEVQTIGSLYWGDPAPDFLIFRRRE